MAERLNKFLARAGLGSRRHCDELIRRGRVIIDGKKIKELGTQVEDGQEVIVDGKPVSAEKLVYWFVNKPKGYLCTNYDPEGRPRVIDLVPHLRQRVYTVGRLDEQSEGLLLLTNDGTLANRLMHPRYGVSKTYLVQVAGEPTKEDYQKLHEGVWLSEGRVKARKAHRVRKQGDSTWVRIILNEGKNREIRRMLAQLEHKVLNLKRIAIGPLAIGHLSLGRSRPLRENEIAKLKHASDPNRQQEEKAEKKPRRESTNNKRERLQKSRNRKRALVGASSRSSRKKPR